MRMSKPSGWECRQMHEIIERGIGEQRNLLEPEALALFSKYGLPVPVYEVAGTQQQALKAAESIGYPVVLKVVSQAIVHKSEIGGVKTGLDCETAVKEAWEEITRSVDSIGERSSMEGVLVCAQAPPGLECIIGIVKDPQFGHAIMFGLGGIFVELIKDAAFRVLPITRQDAGELVCETKSHQLLRGIRGQKPKDIAVVIDCLMKIAALVEENPAIREIDINPIVVFEKGAMILDARVML